MFAYLFVPHRDDDISRYVTKQASQVIGYLREMMVISAVLVVFKGFSVSQ